MFLLVVVVVVVVVVVSSVTFHLKMFQCCDFFRRTSADEGLKKYQSPSGGKKHRAKTRQRPEGARGNCLPFSHAVGIQAPCHRMIGVYNHLQNAK